MAEERCDYRQLWSLIFVTLASAHAGPLLMSILLMRLSGIALLEQDIDEH